MCIRREWETTRLIAKSVILTFAPPTPTNRIPAPLTFLLERCRYADTPYTLLEQQQ